MSYHLPPSRVPGLLARPQQRQPLPPYPIYPLAAAQPLPPGVELQPLPRQRRFGLREILIGVAVVLVIMLVLYWLDQRRRRRERAEVRANAREVERINSRKRSTAQMAKDLYRRLEERGGANETTMRSLAQLSKNA